MPSETQDPPSQYEAPPHSPPRNNSPINNGIALVANSESMSDDGSVDLLSSPTPSTTKDNDEQSNFEKDGASDIDNGIVIGALDTKIDPNDGHCWSCLVNLRSTSATGSPTQSSDECGFLYTTHEHPLLKIMVCSVCEERAEAVESDVLDIEDDTTNLNPPVEMNACSWCGLDDQELGDNENCVKDGVPGSDLLLCDKCPRAFCVRCVMLSLGGDKSSWELVRDVLKSDEEWVCCKCKPTDYLQRLQSAYNKITCSSPSPSDDNEDGKLSPTPDSKDDDHVQKLIDELEQAEQGIEEATKMLDESLMEKERDRIEQEMFDEGISPEDIDGEAEKELESYKRKWQLNFDRCSDTVARLQDELPPADMIAYYEYRTREKGEKMSDMAPHYKIEADLELDKRDNQDGFNKGEFRGASGYKCQNPRVLKLEPEDLNAACLNEIEDVNTMEGAILQMQSNANGRDEKNPWRSQTGTTEVDIEMFKKKAVMFENITLGDRIDLEQLEKRTSTEKEDARATRKEGSMVVRRKGSGNKLVRVVKRGTSLRAFKKQVRKNSTKSRLSGDKKEYQPRLPPPSNNTNTKPATVPRAKKRAQLQRLSIDNSNSTSSGQLSPTMKGMIIGDPTASYEDSDFVLEVSGGSTPVTVCKSLATLLKEHQADGLKFCWRNVCSQIMKYKQEGNEDIHGAILAHNMGLGKSFQAVCLLHTLLTHPSLTTPAGTGGRIIQRALLIAPVNTLANWETEFLKWIGESEGRSVPAIRFYPQWDGVKQKMKVVKEWYDSGGILCVSSERYANATKGYLDNAKKKTSGKKSPVPFAEGDKKVDAKEAKKQAKDAEEDSFLRKALFNPGPDIVVLDEVHGMLKSNTTNIYKCLCGLKTRLRLGLTGSPVQNNLLEYFRMASWMRPDCLGTEINFTRKFLDPIMDGMASDCTPSQAEKQEQATTELHGILDKFVHRRDSNILAKDLPFLQESIIHVRQSMVQTKLYKEFRKYQKETDNKGFFKQYHALRPVSNHPAVLIYPDGKNKSSSRPNTPVPESSRSNTPVPELEEKPRIAPEKFAWICDKCQVAKFRTLDEAEAHEELCTGVFDPATAQNAAPVLAVQSKRKTKRDSDEDWYKSFQDKVEKTEGKEYLKGIDLGGKIVLLLQIIAHCDLIGDKVVVFSQSLPTLSYIEEILNSPDWGGFKFYMPDDVRKPNIGNWKKDREYLRIDGSVDAKERGDLIDTFHSDTAAGNQAKLFLISTNAGGLGINLIAANRVVLFDSHWNPAVDLQAVYRCYRYGQTKETFCYRLLAEGSMEQKIYSRAAAKTSLSDFVVDNANPERSFTRQEMNLLQVEDTWIGCDACGKYRMLPPDISAEEVEALPDEWYCKDNIWDPARSTCNAEERSAVYMVKYYERKKREEDEDYVQSQSQFQAQSQGESQSQGWIKTAVAPPAIDERINEYTERDTVLQHLISRTEEKKTTSTSPSGNEKTSSSSKSKMKWVSKWDFNFEKTDKLESTTASAQEEEQTTKSPKKASAKSSPKKKSKKTPPKKSNQSPKKKSTPAGKKSSPTLYEQILSPASSKKKRKSPKKRGAANTEQSEGGSSEKKKMKPSESKQTSKEKVEHAKLATVKVKAELEGGTDSKKPAAKANDEEEKNDAVVDLTFDDSDSD